MGQDKVDTGTFRIDGGLQLQEDQVDNSREMEVSGCLRIGFGEAKEGNNERQGSIDQASILLVDDRPDISEMLSQALTMEGYRVITPVGGARWIDHVLQSEDQPALVLLDLSNPSVEAATFLKNLRARWPAAPPILVMTTSKHIYEKLLAAGEHVLRKPFHVRDFLVEVQKVISSHEQGKNPG